MKFLLRWFARLLAKHIEITVTMEPEYAPKGAGKWTYLRATLYLADVELAHHTSQVDLSAEENGYCGCGR